VLGRGVLASCSKARPDASRTSLPAGILVHAVPPKGVPTWLSDPRTVQPRVQLPEGLCPPARPPEDALTMEGPPEGFPLLDQRRRNAPAPRTFRPESLPVPSAPPEDVATLDKSARRLPDPAQFPTRRPETEHHYVATNPLHGLRGKQLT
jgi:hypothetical protein